MAALNGTSAFRPPFLNGAQRSVNRKVQGSSPCPGAKFEFETSVAVDRCLTALQQQYSNLTATPASSDACRTRLMNSRTLVEAKKLPMHAVQNRKVAQS